jgi:hypothetical protein
VREGPQFSQHYISHFHFEINEPGQKIKRRVQRILNAQSVACKIKGCVDFTFNNEMFGEQEKFGLQQN